MTHQQAATTLNQLGGKRFTMMTGAKNFSLGKNSISFKISRGAKNGINHIEITLNSEDTYSITFARLHGTNYTIKGGVVGIYFDQLKAVFTEYTGFYTSL